LHQISPITSWAQSRLDIPILKGTSGILIFTPVMKTGQYQKAAD